MKKLWLMWCLALICAAPALATSTRSLSDQISAADIEAVVLETGVGDIELIAVDQERISYQVVLEPRRGGFFSSKRRAEREVQEANLDATVSGSSLYLRVRSDSSERRFEETWTIELPSRLAVELEHGVGNVSIRGIAGGVDLETGVGDIEVTVETGDINIDVGVGDIKVVARAHAYESAECSAGVGNAHLRIDGKKIGDGGFLGNSSAWSGDGQYEIRVDVGVGDAEIVLD